MLTVKVSYFLLRFCLSAIVHFPSVFLISWYLQICEPLLLISVTVLQCILMGLHIFLVTSVFSNADSIGWNASRLM